MVKSVVALIIKDENILLLKRYPFDKTYPNHLCLPGGKVENNETREQALFREVKEETGLLIEKPLWFNSSTSKTKNVEFEIECYLVRDFKGSLQFFPSKEHEKAEFVKLDKLAGYIERLDNEEENSHVKIGPATKKFLFHFLEQNGYPTSIKEEKKKIELELQKKKIIYQPNDIINFGKYKSKMVYEVYQNDPKYISWALNNVSFFDLPSPMKEHLTSVVIKLQKEQDEAIEAYKQQEWEKHSQQAAEVYRKKALENATDTHFGRAEHIGAGLYKVLEGRHEGKILEDEGWGCFVQYRDDEEGFSL